MERVIIFIILALCMFCVKPAFGEEGTNLSNLITAQNIKYQDCTKVFNIDNINLLYLTIASINANRFTVDEIQSRNGYVIFTAVNKKFLATITNVNTNQAMLKITPVDNNYYFQPGIYLNIFKYIDLNLRNKAENIYFTENQSNN
ncbi:hypothetical protein IJ596_05590 [bacterium]|nr:hypothetical protein [bacterium]